MDWSSDGTIAFSALDYRDGAQEDTDLYFVQPDGSDLEQLTDTPQRAETRPRYSPDGRRLVYRALADNCLRLVAANADGTDPQPVRTGCRTWEGSWSPDSRRLLVMRYNGQRNRNEVWDTTVDGASGRFVVAGEDATWRPR